MSSQGGGPARGGDAASRARRRGGCEVEPGEAAPRAAARREASQRRRRGAGVAAQAALRRLGAGGAAQARRRWRCAGGAARASELHSALASLRLGTVGNSGDRLAQRLPRRQGWYSVTPASSQRL